VWPRVDPGPGPWTPESVVAVGERVVIARGKRAAVLIVQGGLLGCVGVLVGVGNFVWRSRLELVVLIAVVSGTIGAGSLWVWNAIVVPRWWAWAVGSGVDPDRLVSLATKAMLIGEKDLWWQAKLSARGRAAGGPAL
jgi:hypothetical protein